MLTFWAIYLIVVFMFLIILILYFFLWWTAVPLLCSHLFFRFHSDPDWAFCFVFQYTSHSYLNPMYSWCKEKNTNKLKAHFCWLHLIDFMVLLRLKDMEIAVLSFWRVWRLLLREKVCLLTVTCHSIHSLWQHLPQTLPSYLPSGVLHNLWWQFKDIDPRQMVSDSYKFVCWTLCLFPFLSFSGLSTGNMDQIERLVWHRWMLAHWNQLECSATMTLYNSLMKEPNLGKIDEEHIIHWTNFSLNIKCLGLFSYLFFFSPRLSE